MLKGARCETAKCPMERQWRNAPPGMHSWRRRRGSEYQLRLREKQKVKRYYGVFERQFVRYYRTAERRRGDTGALLLSILESRLDNVAHKLGFAASRAAARQLINHGHIRVNGKRCNIPSYTVSVGDRISVKDNEKSRKQVQASLEEFGDQNLQSWLKLDKSKLEGEVVALPTRDDVMIPVEEHLIVEYCGR